MRTTYLVPIVALFVAVGFFAPPKPAHAVETRAPEAKIFSTATSQATKTFEAFPTAFKGGGYVAIGNILGDSKPEIVIGAGRGGGPHVRVFDSQGNFTGYSFFPFSPDFRGGVDVALGDIDGDGKLELICSQAGDGQGWVKAYEVDAERTVLAEFMAYPPTFLGGARVATGDINGDGTDEILTASGMGSSGHIRAFDKTGRWTGFQLFPFEASHKGGADVAAGNFYGGRKDQVIVTKATFGAAHVKVYDTYPDRVIADFKALPDAYKEGIEVATGNFDADAQDELILATSGGGPQLIAAEFTGVQLPFHPLAYEGDFRGGTHVAAGELLATSANMEVVSMPGRRIWLGRPGVYRYIDVNLSQQRLQVYEAGRVVMDFLISSGVAKHPSPVGNFNILAKNPLQRYRFEYGPGNPDNYDLPDVPWNMRFFGPYFLHGAYWHNNFGRRMSHGCINISIPNAKRLYDWSRIGDPVFLHN